MKELNLKIPHILAIVCLSIALTTAIFNLDYFFCLKIRDTTVLSEFGTFYGGIIGTTVASFGFYFIIKTFRIQEQQFDIVKKDADFNIINTLYDNLLSEIDSIQFRKKGIEGAPDEILTGIDALYNFDIESLKSSNAVVNHLQSILIAFEHLLLLADKKIRYKYSEQKNIMLTRINFLYYEKIMWPVYESFFKRGVRSQLEEQNHPGTDKLFAKYEELTAKSYLFLIEKQYVGEPTEPEIARILEKARHITNQLN